MVTSRPTAVNVAYEAEKLKKFCLNLKSQTNDKSDFEKKYLKDYFPFK
jgi:hypothetical protein